MSHRETVFDPRMPVGPVVPPKSLIGRSPADSAVDRTHGAVTTVADVLGSPGSALDRPAAALMGQRFAEDFSRVRVHTGERAAASASSLDARAYTFGNHIVFGPGQFAPHTPAGRRLLAHELAHVVQQGARWPSLGERLDVGSPSDQWEAQADRAADSIAAGGMPAAVSRGRAPALQRAPTTPDLKLSEAAGQRALGFKPPEPENPLTAATPKRDAPAGADLDLDITIGGRLVISLPTGAKLKLPKDLTNGRRLNFELNYDSPGKVDAKLTLDTKDVATVTLSLGAEYDTQKRTTSGRIGLDVGFGKMVCQGPTADVTRAKLEKSANDLIEAGNQAKETASGSPKNLLAARAAVDAISEINETITKARGACEKYHRFGVGAGVEGQISPDSLTTRRGADYVPPEVVGGVRGIARF